VRIESLVLDESVDYFVVIFEALFVLLMKACSYLSCVE
jgi:hypothetical protein